MMIFQNKSKAKKTTGINIPSKEKYVGEKMKKKKITSYCSIVPHRFGVETRPGDKLVMFGCKCY